MDLSKRYFGFHEVFYIRKSDDTEELFLENFYQRTKDYQLAEVHFFCALETYPYEPVIHILICKLYIKTNDLSSAKHHYESALSMDASSKDRKLENILNI